MSVVVCEKCKEMYFDGYGWCSCEEKPPTSNRGVTFLTPPKKGQVSLPFCCQLREQMGFLQEGMEEARRRFDDAMYNSNLEDWKGLYDQWMFELWCDACKAEFERVLWQ